MKKRVAMESWASVGEALAATWKFLQSSSSTLSTPATSYALPTATWQSLLFTSLYIDRFSESTCTFVKFTNGLDGRSVLCGRRPRLCVSLRVLHA